MCNKCVQHPTQDPADLGNLGYFKVKVGFSFQGEKKSAVLNFVTWSWAMVIWLVNCVSLHIVQYRDQHKITRSKAFKLWTVPFVVHHSKPDAWNIGSLFVFHNLCQISFLLLQIAKLLEWAVRSYSQWYTHSGLNQPTFWFTNICFWCLNVTHK